MNQPDLKKEFKGLCRHLSLHEIQQNPELDDATRAMELTLYRLKRQLREDQEEENTEDQKVMSNYEN